MCNQMIEKLSEVKAHTGSEIDFTTNASAFQLREVSSGDVSLQLNIYIYIYNLTM